MPSKRLFLKMTSLTQTFTVTLNRLKSLKLENISFTGDTYKQIVYVSIVGNPAAVSPAVPIDLSVNSFINQAGTAVDYTFIQRGDLNTTNVIQANRVTPDIVIENSTTNITALEVTIAAETGTLNINTNNPICMEVIAEMYY